MPKSEPPSANEPPADTVAADQTSTSAGVLPLPLPAGSSATLAPGANVGRYVIIEPLGEGGMGVVYLANDPDLDRRVALKLLRPKGSDGGTDGRSRLVREAHAMAKLNHPNVVAIYDSGVFDNQVFLAVELVEGTTLKAWLSAAPRGWREILDVFLLAGRGLSVAHAAGLVHRDFKPDNVLIGKAGEVKVADFGLARAVVASVPRDLPSEPDASTVTDLGAHDVLATPLTRTGAVSGTPAYMAPEQALGRDVDARTDEFSFAVSLYRSLYGELPFEKRLDPLGTNTLKPPPKGTRVPSWVRRALVRALSIKPEDRYPTLAAMLDVLAADPAVRRRHALRLASIVALVVGAATATGVLVLHKQAAADACHEPQGRLADVWDDGVRARVRAAFAATGAPEAESTVTYAENAMDRATTKWLHAYRDACLATRERHTQPEAALLLRLDCLNDQRFDLRAAAELMLHPDPKNLGAVIGAGATLPLPLECADPHALSVVEPPPAERRAAVEALRFKIARGRALRGAGRCAEAKDALSPLPGEAEALGVHALEAQVLVDLGDSLACAHGADNYKSAREMFGRAAGVAERARVDPLATRATARWLMADAMGGSSRTEIESLVARAREDLRRAGLGGTAEYYVEDASMNEAGFHGRNAEAAMHGRRALELADALFGTDRRETLNTTNNLAANLEPLGLYVEMAGLYQKAVAVSDSLLGPRSPQAAPFQVNLAEASFDLGHLAECEEALDQIKLRLSGEKDREELAIALAIRSAVRSAQGRIDDSRREDDASLAMGERLHMLATPNGVDLHRYLIEAKLRRRDAAAAIVEFEKYLAHQDQQEDSPAWVAFLRLGGWAYLDAGKPELAVPTLERALSLSSAHPFYPGWVPRLRYQLAKSLLLTHGDRARAESLAREAHDELLGLGERTDLLAEVDSWRAGAFTEH